MKVDNEFPSLKKIGQYLPSDPLLLEKALALQDQIGAKGQRIMLGKLLLQEKAITSQELNSALLFQRFDRLASCPLFTDISQKELANITPFMMEISVEEGEEIITQDTKADCFYILANGRAEVCRLGAHGETISLAIIEPVESIGEMGYFFDSYRIASVYAKERCELVRIDFADLQDFFKKSPPSIAKNFLAMIATRLRRTDIHFQEATLAQLLEKERFEHELQLAADIQRSILPDELPEVDGFSFGVSILPARHVGGDFYDVFRIDDYRMGLLIGDVADKGVPASLFMARTHALIMAEASKGVSAGEVIELVNRHIMRMNKQTQFVTIVYGILNLETRELNYARAGHEPPLVLSTDGSVERLPYKRSIPVGSMEDIVIDLQRVALLPGETLVMYTDGMSDCRNLGGEPFGLERIMQTLGVLVDHNAQQVCDTLMEALKNYHEGTKQDDDVALLAIHVAREESTVIAN
jgi:serine phosphatase RsbU (regulator of sigma subunit)